MKHLLTGASTKTGKDPNTMNHLMPLLHGLVCNLISASFPCGQKHLHVLALCYYGYPSSKKTVTPLKL